MQALEARDNARFLATLERHLRALEGGSLQSVADALAPLLNALRMVRECVPTCQIWMCSHTGCVLVLMHQSKNMLLLLLQIWGISRHYSDDVHMSGLLERIAGSIQARRVPCGRVICRHARCCFSLVAPICDAHAS